jgi:malto-oligosyltrehalose trehalohydrolase
MRRRRDLPFGATLVADGVRFRLWAPAARAVELVLDGGRAPMFMPPEGDGWFALTTGAAGAGERYRYRVDGLDVPDPASRFQPEDVHGNSEIIDPAAYEWRDQGWRGRPWEEIVLYELHVGTFSRDGDFAGAIAHLDRVVALGATAVEIMPVADFAGRRNWGYDGVLPFAPATAYGRPDDLKRLVEACHRRGLAVLLDVVYNHFGPEGNYLGRYAPAFFTNRHHTPWGAAINFDGDDAQAVRAFYVENTLYWLEEFHFDGLRFDAVHAIIDDSPRHILAEIADAVAARFARERPVHLVLENDRNEAWPLARRDGRPYRYVGQWNDDLHHALHVIATGDTAGYYGDYAEAPVARLGRALAEGFAFQGEPSAYRDGARRGEASAHLPPTAFVAFVQNHDQVGNTPLGTRLAQVAPVERVRLVTAIALLSPQIPLLFMGEEWATERPFPFFCDFEPGLADKVREGRRREFADFPGFHEQIPDPCAAETFESAKLDWDAREREPHRAWLDWYRKVLAVRAHEIVPRLSGIPGSAGAFTPIGAGGLAVAWRLGDGSRLLLHANFGTSALALDRAPPGRLLFAQPAGVGDGRCDVLPPLSAAFHLDET